MAATAARNPPTPPHGRMADSSAKSGSLPRHPQGRTRKTSRLVEHRPRRLQRRAFPESRVEQRSRSRRRNWPWRVPGRRGLEGHFDADAFPSCCLEGLRSRWGQCAPRAAKSVALPWSPWGQSASSSLPAAVLSLRPSPWPSHSQAHPRSQQVAA